MAGERKMTRLETSIEAINDALINASDSQLLIGAKCRGLMRGYEARWGHLEYEVTAVENFVEADLWNPETGRASRSFRIGGKLDATHFAGQSIIVDHKTTSDDISDPSGPYWKNLVIEAQVSHYWLLEHLNGRKPESAMWDVVRKPSISPKNVAKAEVLRVAITRQYCGSQVSDESVAEMEATGRESLEMYEARLAEECIRERPQRYFQRRTIPRMDSEILEYANELWDNAKTMLHTRQLTRETGRLPQRHSGACFSYNRPCKFLGLCSGTNTVDSGDWQVKEKVHSELPMLQGDGRDLLTVSRLKMFQLCPRKEYYSYQLGIEKIDEEEAESLYFGSLLHKSLEAYWTYGMASIEQKEEVCQLA
jgi:hypothetical protein